MRHRLDQQGKPNLRQLRKMGLGVLAYVLLAAVLFLGGMLLDKQAENATKEDSYGDLSERFTPTLTMEVDGQEYAYYHNYYSNVLIIGVDRESIAEMTSMRSGGQADFLLLLAISRNNKSITPIHIDRDTVAEVKVFGAFGNPAGTSPMQLCLSHAFGRDEATNSANTLWAVSNLLGGIPIDHYITMDMSGIAALNDALGGVTVTLEEDFSAIDPAMTKGTTLRLQGKQAEYYVRGRYGVGDYTNSQRMTHQRTFISAATELLKDRLKEEPEFLVQLFDDLGSHLSTTIADDWLLEQSYAMQHYTVNDTRTLDGEHRMGDNGFMEFHPEEDSLEELLLNVFYEERTGG